MKNIILKRCILLASIFLLLGVCIIPSINSETNFDIKRFKTSKSIDFDTNFLPSDSQSTSGPVPPINCDMGLDLALITNQTIISGVPAYLWIHGCGPTAAGMVIGYWDGHGYDGFISGNASTQTYLVNQAIASGGNQSNPNPPGLERHYEDYARPQDSPPNMKPDDYITQNRTPHIDNCLADFMDTSKSTRENYYGWSWFSDVDDSMSDYVKSINPNYNVIAYNLIWGELTWEKFCREIDENRPVVLLVDSNGDGGTDHFVTAIGHDDSHNYACYNTWDENIHWYDFSKISSGNTWGIYGATFFAIGKGEFHIGLIWGQYDSMIRFDKKILIDCNFKSLNIFGYGKRSNGNIMCFESDFTKISTDMFLGLPIRGFMLGIIAKCVIY